jgi:hypothetical protein
MVEVMKRRSAAKGCRNDNKRQQLKRPVVQFQVQVVHLGLNLRKDAHRRLLVAFAHGVNAQMNGVFYETAHEEHAILELVQLLLKRVRHGSKRPHCATPAYARFVT